MNFTNLIGTNDDEKGHKERRTPSQRRQECSLTTEGEGTDCQGQNIPIREQLLRVDIQTREFNVVCSDVLKRLLSMDSAEDLQMIGPSFVSDLRQTSDLANRLRLKLHPFRLGDPIFEVFRFLSRKELFHSVQLVDRRMRAIVSQRDAHWPRFRFHQLQMFGDDELKRTSKMFLFKNAVQLKPPPAELSTIFISLSSKVELDKSDEKLLADPVELVVHHSGNAENGRPLNVFFFIDVEEEAEEEGEDNSEERWEDGGCVRCGGRRGRAVGTKFFFRLPNLLSTAMALSHCVWLFREFSKAHFDEVRFELYRLTNAFHLLLHRFAVKRHCLPLLCHTLQTFHPLSVPFLQLFVRPSERASVWDLHGTTEFFCYLVRGQRQETEPAEEANDGPNVKRTPDRFSAWGFVPQAVVIPSTDSFSSVSSATGEMSFFDALIHYARLTKCPDKIVKRISLNFKQNPSPWPHIVPGMRLIYRTQTMQVDEEAEEGDEAEKECVEMRYRLCGVANSGKFEVRVECEPGRVNEEMYAFELIQEEEKEGR
uniref:F-box domain-containing protein n=1 Tax=Globodera rostochiensis TaxID=31243 RepID=A0A914GU41_GLORO